MDDGLLVAMRKGDYKYVYAEQRAPGQLQVWAEPFTKLRLTSVCISHIAPRSAPRWMEPAKPRAWAARMRRCAVVADHAEFPTVAVRAHPICGRAGPRR